MFGWLARSSVGWWVAGWRGLAGCLLLRALLQRRGCQGSLGYGWPVNGLLDCLDAHTPINGNRKHHCDERQHQHCCPSCLHRREISSPKQSINYCCNLIFSKQLANYCDNLTSSQPNSDYYNTLTSSEQHSDERSKQIFQNNTANKAPIFAASLGHWDGSVLNLRSNTLIMREACIFEATQNTVYAVLHR